MPEGGFSPERYQEMKKTPEARDYRDAMATAIKAARAYDGTQKKYESLMSSLERVQETVESTVTSSTSSAPSALDLEIETAFKFAPLQPRDLNDVLAIAEESRKKFLRRSIEEPEAEDSPLLIRKIDEVILPPDKDLKIEIKTGEEPFTPAEFERRVDSFLSMLAQNDIYADDVIITVGREPKNSFRHTSYTHVEIPRLHRVVLLCDQIGEATFVLRAYLDPTTPWTKEQLMEKLGGDCRRIVKHGQKHWEEELRKYLFQPDAWQDGHKDSFEDSKRKIDVRSHEGLRSVLKEMYAPKTFLDAFGRAERVRKVQGLGWASILKNLQIEGSIDARPTRLEVAKFVWGVGHPEVQRWVELYARTQDEWRNLIKHGWTPETWYRMTDPQRLAIKIDGFGYSALASFAGAPVITPKRTMFENNLAFGKYLWGEEAFAGFEQTQDRTPPPEGWKTTSALAREMSASHETVKRRVEELQVRHPEWFKEYWLRTDRSLFLSPDAIKAIKEALEGARPPEGWVSYSRLTERFGRGYNAVRARAQKLIKAEIEARRRQGDDQIGESAFVGRYREISSKPTEYISPHIVDLMAKEFGEDARLLDEEE